MVFNLGFSRVRRDSPQTSHGLLLRVCKDLWRFFRKWLRPQRREGANIAHFEYYIFIVLSVLFGRLCDDDELADLLCAIIFDLVTGRRFAPREFHLRYATLAL